MKIENITKRFDKKTIFENFSLELPQKGVVFIEGPSGIGKTTLLNIISGLTNVDRGKVEVQKVSYLFQEDRLLEWISVFENVFCVTNQNSNDKIKCETILEKLGLKDELNSFPSQLSGGMLRRVAIARTLVYDAEIVILDEPFKGLDVKTLENTINVIKENTKDKLLIIVSHQDDKKYFENYQVVNIGK
jgi:NitT/TauT family transport system ATP-binding protein